MPTYTQPEPAEYSIVRLHSMRGLPVQVPRESYKVALELTRRSPSDQRVLADYVEADASIVNAGVIRLLLELAMKEPSQDPRNIREIVTIRLGLQGLENLLGKEGVDREDIEGRILHLKRILEQLEQRDA